MYNRSNRWKKKIYNNVQTFINIYIDNVLINSKYLFEFKKGGTLFDGNFQLGSIPSQYIEFKIKKGLVQNPKKVKVEYGLIYSDYSYTVEEIHNMMISVLNNTKVVNLIPNFETIPIGIYNVDEYNDNDGKTTTIKALDDMIKLDAEDGYYDASELIKTKGYATLGEIAQDICNKKGVELGSTSFLHSNKKIYVYDNQVTAREYISYIAEQANCFAVIGRDGKLYFRQIGQDEETIPLKLFKTHKFGEEYKISRVAYENGIENFKFGNTTRNTLWLNQENLFIVDEEQVQNIYNNTKDLTINSFEGTVVIDPAIDIGDKITIDGKTIIYQGEMRLQGRFISDIKSTISIKAKEETTTRKASQKVINRRVQSRIDEEAGKIETLVEQQDEQNAKVSKIEQDIDGFKKTISDVEETQEGLIEKVNKTEETAEGNKTTISNVETKVTTAQNTANDAKTKAENAQSKANSVDNNLTNNYYKKTDVYTKTETASEFSRTISSKIEEIQVGGRNLVLNSDDYIETSSSTNTSKTFQFNVEEFKKLAGKQIVMSMDIELINAVYNSSATANKRRIVAELSITHTDDTTQYCDLVYNLSEVAETTKKRISTVTQISNKEIKSVTAKTIGIYIQGLGSGTVKAGRLKVEVGNKSTDWTPAPEDIENELKVTEEKVTKIEQNVDSITQSVTAIKDNTVENIVNGDFKNNFNNWTKSSSGIMEIKTINNVKWLHMGVYAGDVPDYVQQKITTLIESTQYKLAFNAYHAVNSEGVINADIEFYNSSNTLLSKKGTSFHLSSSEQSYNWEFSTPKTFEYAILKFWAIGYPDKEIYLKDVSVIGGALWQRVTELQLSVDGVKSEVKEKVGNEEIISKINQSAEKISINANKIDIDGKAIHFKTDIKTTVGPFTETDRQKIIGYLLGNTQLTTAEFKKYDLDEDNVINSWELLIIKRAILNGGYYTFDGKFEINPYSANKTMNILNGNNKITTVMSPLKNYFTELFVDNIIINDSFSFTDVDGQDKITIFNNKVNERDIFEFIVKGYFSLQQGDFSISNGNFSMNQGNFIFKNGSLILGSNDNNANKINFDLYLKNDANIYGNLDVQGNVYSYNISSDRRIKKNIKNSTTNALDIIKQIKHKQFEMKSDNKHYNIGYIAQEMEEIDPNFVLKKEKTENSDEKYYINELPIIATATKAIQEQNELIEEMQKEIETLKQEIKELKEEK